MSYHEKVAAFQRFAVPAIMRIIPELSDLFLSLNEAKTADAIASFERLNAESIETPKSVEDMVLIHKRALGYLLYTKKIVPASYGLSAQGKVQFDSLVALVHAPAQTEDPRTVEYQEFKKRADVAEYQTRLAADAEFRQWANASR